MDFLLYIEKNYDSIKQLLKNYKDFNEDVFHNTIIKCNEIISLNQLKFNDENTILKYLIGSYKTNILREKLYYYNKNSVHEAKLEEYDKPTSEYIETYADISVIKDSITLKFSLQLSDVYFKYITEGYSILKLQEITGIKNLKLKIKDIKTYIHNKYKKD